MIWKRVKCAPLPMQFSRQEFWHGLPLLPARDLPNPGIEPESLHRRQILYPLSHQGGLNVDQCPINVG